MGPEFISEGRLRIAQNRLHERRVNIAAADDNAHTALSFDDSA